MSNEAEVEVDREEPKADPQAVEVEQAKRREKIQDDMIQWARNLLDLAEARQLEWMGFVASKRDDSEVYSACPYAEGSVFEFLGGVEYLKSRVSRSLIEDPCDCPCRAGQ